MSITRAPQAIVLAQSAVAVPLTGSTTETALATIPIPAGTMGANGGLRIRAKFSFPSSANNKTIKIKFGALVAETIVITTNTTVLIDTEVMNRGGAASQAGATVRVYNSGTTQRLDTTGTVDTTADVSLQITGQLALGSETLTLESHQVLLYPKN